MDNQGIARTPTISDALFEGLALDVERDAPIGSLTWYRVGGSAEALVDPEDEASLGTLLSRCAESSVPVRVLGSGANLLVSEAGVPGVVIRLTHKSFRMLRGLEDRSGRLVVGSGYDLMRLVNETAREGLSGLEGLAGVPATVGGAIRMNAGGAYGQIADVVRSVRVMDLDGTTTTLEREQIPFGYRRSGIEQPLILEAVLQLECVGGEAVYLRKKEIFAKKTTEQPFADATAGCAFKNPVDEAGRQVDSAGRLIDACGLKGARVGGAYVSEVHANFIAAGAGATADDVIQLFRQVQERVEAATGVRLVREVVVWP
ncbi:UDP-N-acetylmuramate dehydrogenase [Mucisphaera sp.]|uniref:UDP-N-acetylmuramate dehydrogenase n=1 Tax=Mucisphaera sp. TaxID=2913024 RepID=UPI003D0D95E4